MRVCLCISVYAYACVHTCLCDHVLACMHVFVCVEGKEGGKTGYKGGPI